jgi:hypothetical protein
MQGLGDDDAVEGVLVDHRQLKDACQDCIVDR